MMASSNVKIFAAASLILNIIQCKINRMPGSHFLCRKDQLTINYKWLQSKAGKDKCDHRKDLLFVQVRIN